ncbi:16828_t:CDS:2, partial [Funneliformis caledonium]
AQQPNFTNLAQAIQAVAQEFALFSNLPSMNFESRFRKLQQDLETYITNNSNRNFNNMMAIIRNSDARSLARTFNSRIYDPNVNLEPIPDLNGEVPPTFPENVAALRALTGQQLDVLLNFYDLQTNGSVANRRERLARNFGLFYYK